MLFLGLLLTLIGCTSDKGKAIKSNANNIIKMTDGRYKIECQGLAATSGLNPTVKILDNNVIIQYGIGSFGLIISKNCLIEQIALN